MGERALELITGSEPITLGQLREATKDLPDDTAISICIGPMYEDVALTDAVYWEKHGAVFLLGEKEDEDDDEEEDDPPIEGEWVEVPRPEEEPEEYIDTSAADPA